MIRKKIFILIILTPLINYSQSGTFSFQSDSNSSGFIFEQNVGGVTVTLTYGPGSISINLLDISSDVSLTSGNSIWANSEASSATFTFSTLVNIESIVCFDGSLIAPTIRDWTFTTNSGSSVTVTNLDGYTGKTATLNFSEITSFTVTATSGSGGEAFGFDNLVMTNAFAYNVTGLTVGSITTNQIPLSWTNPSPSTGVIVLCKASSSVSTSIPSVSYSSIPSANSDFTLAPDAASGFGSSGDKLVYKGTGTSFTTTNLTNGTSYYFKVFNWDGSFWSSGKTTNGNQALPVELTSFTTIAKANTVTLNWGTATELNNYGFEVQRSAISNQSTSESWEALGFVYGSGNSNSPKSYSFVDKTPLAGNVLYRLKQIDFDGTYKYYEPSDVTFNVAGFQVEQNFPNPFNPETIISYQLAVSSNVMLKIYDSIGKEVATLVNEFQKAGIHRSTFNANNYSLPSGVYFCSIKAGDFIQTKKMILMK